MKLHILLFVVLLCSFADSADGGHFSNPSPTLTVTPAGVMLHMELNGFPNYGVADAAADIAYPADGNTWSFNIPGSVNLAAITRATFRASLVADDHYGYDPSFYTFDIQANGSPVYSGPAGIPHGTPVASVFNNWIQRDFEVPDGPLVSPMTFSLTNTSATPAGEWIAIDWIELHLVPEPTSFVLVFLAVFVAFGVRFRYARNANRSQWA